MPLPWLFVFFMVFLCYFTVTFLVSCSHLSSSLVSVKKMAKASLVLPW